MSATFHFSKALDPACKACGRCCGPWPVPVTQAEIDRIVKLGFSPKNFRRGYIAKRKDGRCCFVGEDGLCVIHKKFGLEVKALACRLYPYDIHLWEDGSISASLRFDCYAVCSSRENLIAKDLPQIARFASELGAMRVTKSPFYSRTIHPSVGRMREITEAYADMIFGGKAPFDVGLYAAARLLRFHEGKNASADILEAEDFRQDASELFDRSAESLTLSLEYAPYPSFDALCGIRYLTASFLRCDQGKNVFGRLDAMVRTFFFTFGRKPLRETGLLLAPGVLFKKLRVEQDAFLPFRRWFEGKLRAMHFCGLPAQDLTFEQGMRCMLLAWPAYVFIARALADESGSSVIRPEHGAEAIRRLDHTFLRTKLYRSRQLLRVAEQIVNSDNYQALLHLAREK